MIHAAHDTAVVILSYNSKKWLDLFLPPLVNHASGYDIVVVDHCSNDGTQEWLYEHYSTSVKVLRLEENHGFAWGYAEALKQIRAQYYVLLSADFEVTQNWFQPMHQLMQEHVDIAACQPKIRYYKDKVYFEYAGAAGGFIDKWGYLFCRGRIFETLEKDEQQYDDNIEIFWASGGCLMVRAAVYHQLGGLDADLYAHMEEVDLCWRIKNAGHRIAYVAASTVYHVGGSVISYGSPQKTFYNFRNNLILLLKNDKASKLIWLLPLRLVLDGVAGIRFLMKGDFKNIAAIIKAHFNFYFTFSKWYKKRQLSKELITKRNEVGFFSKSIIVSYFLKSKKKFSELEITTVKIK